MALPPSTANWHWKTKYVTPWAKTWFEQELTKLRVTGKDIEEASITKVSEVEGDVELGQRKSKLITIYDCRICLDWSGTASDGTDVSGSLTIPEVSHENSVDGLSEYTFEWQLSTTGSPPVDALFGLVKTQLRSAIETKLAEFPVALVETHGKDLTVSGEPSRSGTPANGTATPNNSSNPNVLSSTATAGSSKTESSSGKVPAVKSTTTKAVNTATVTVEGTFQAAADDLYSLFTDESRIPMWSRAPAQSKVEVGGAFSLFGGGVKGEYKSLTPGKEIVQSWILNNPKWPAGQDGTMTITFQQGSDATKVIFRLSGVPKGLEDEINQNLQGIRGMKSIGFISHLAASRPNFPRKTNLNVHVVPLMMRTVASTVSHKPGSQTIPQAAQNIKEETGNSATDLAKTIAGNLPDALSPEKNNFFGITGIVAGEVPKPIMVMGLAGGLPYLGTALTTAYLARQAGLAASGALSTIDPATAMNLLMDCLHIQVTYGAVLMSFTAAIHWGMEFSGYNGNKGYPRLMLGALPVVYAWSTLAFDPIFALIAQWLGFTTLWFADMKVTTAGWTPKWYSQYRFYLSILVGTCIIGTLATASYFGPYPGHDATQHHLNVMRDKRRKTRGDFANEVGGNIEAVPAGEEADAYVKIVKKKTPEEEAEGDSEAASGGETEGEAEEGSG